jgi:Zn finger protein HypA/HybF involved in hydrogenase expression
MENSKEKAVKGLEKEDFRNMRESALSMCERRDELLQEVLELERREAELGKQARMIECDDAPVNVEKAKGKQRLELELRDAYCYKCASPELKITRIIQIECRKCGRKRLITSRLDESKR